MAKKILKKAKKSVKSAMLMKKAKKPLKRSSIKRVVIKARKVVGSKAKAGASKAKIALNKAKLSSMKRAATAKSKKLIAEKMEEETKQAKYLEEAKKIGVLVENKTLLSNVSNNVGAGAIDILSILAKGPKTDEDISEKLNIKVNDVRRMLNVMNSYSIVRYDVNKDSKGWLIFTWRIDSEKLSEYVININREDVIETVLPGNCNDFFLCKICYDKEKTILPFDSAFESDFTCNSCGKPFTILSREETVALFKTVKATL